LRKDVADYLVTLPERLVRSVVGLGAGLAREVSDLVLPDSVRQGQLYRNMVDSTLRFLIEQVGGAEGTYAAEAQLPGNFLARRTAGNAVEVLGVVAFRASPVWVLAGMADVCGLGRHLIPQLADELKKQGLIEPGATVESMDEILDGLERTSARMASAINTPPLDVASLRAEWTAIREEARKLQPSSLPSPEMVTGLWDRLRIEAEAQQRSVFETSSALALSAIRSVPDGIRWVSASAVATAGLTGRVVGGVLLEHYSQTLDEVRQVGYAEYASRQLTPYVRAAVAQFSPEQQTLTERLLGRLRKPPVPSEPPADTQDR
jgi:hypothetical protein